MRHFFTKSTLVFFLTIAASTAVADDYILKILDVAADPGTEILIEVEIINDDNFVAFAMDILLPEGFTYISESYALNPARSNGHSPLSQYYSSTNVLKIGAFSIQNNIFNGNDGVVASFLLQTPNEAGTYLLDIEAPNITYGGFNVLTEAIPGTVHLGEEEPVEQYTLTINLEGQGMVRVNGNIYTSPVTIDEGTVLNLTAHPFKGWQFVEWTGDHTGNVSSVTIIMDDNKTINAKFSEITATQHTLELYAFGSGNLFVNENPYTGPVSVDAGFIVTIDAQPDSGWQFDGWTGDHTGSTTPIAITMDQDKSIIANFSELPVEEYLLEISINGNGNVKVDGILYSDPITVEEGTSLSLIAIPGDNWVFEHWAGDAAGNNPSLEIVMDGDKSISAVFAEYEESENTMRINDVEGEAGQVIELELDIINDDQFVGFQAEIVIPNGFSYVDGSAYLNPDRAGSHSLNIFTGENLLNFMVYEASEYFIGHEGPVLFFSLLAANAPGDYPLNINSAGIIDDEANNILTHIENGIVTLTPAALSYIISASASANGSINPEGDVIVPKGASQPFNVVADNFYSLDALLVDGIPILTEDDTNWDADNGIYTFVNVIQEHTIEAIFAINTYNINVTANDDSYGTVTGGGSYEHFETATLEAVANTGYHFVNWTENGEVVMDGDEPAGVTYAFMVEGPRALIANFAINTYTINVTANEDAYGTVTGGGTYEHFETATLEAVANTGYHFANWTENGEVVMDGDELAGETYAFMVEGPRSLIAHFAINTYSIDVTANEDAYGTVTGGGTYEHFETAILETAPSIGYHFVNWTENGEVVMDGDEIAGETYSFMVDSPRALIANFKINVYTLTYSAGPNGSLAGETQQMIDHGNSSTPVEAIPDEGYHFVQWSDGITQNPRIEENVTTNIAAEAEFAINTYVIMASAGEGGSIIPDGEVIVNHGSDQLFIIEVAEGYDIHDILVDGASVGQVQEYLFENVTTAHTIEAQFILQTFIVYASSGDNGNIEPEGEIIADYGSSVTFTITAEAGHHLDQLVIDGQVVNPVYSYTFEDITQNHSIHSEFNINTYTITATASSGGGISPEGTVFVSHGGSRAFVMTPEAGYHIEDVIVDEINIGPVPEYTFINITQNHSIHASFLINTYTLLYFAGENGYIEGDTVQYVEHGGNATPIEAFADEGYHFANWSDGVFDNPRADTGVSDDINATANFSINTYTITVNANEDAYGTVTGGGTYEHFETATLEAVANTGYHFANWTENGEVVMDGDELAGETYAFMVEGPRSLVANFAINTYTINVTANEDAYGTVTGGGIYEHFETATLEAFANTGYHFANWTENGEVVMDGDEPAGENYAFMVEGPRSLVANFAINTYTINVTANEDSYGTVTGGGAYEHFETATLEAVANTGYHFANWTENGEVVMDGDEPAGETYAFVVEGPRSLVANFAINTYTLLYEADTNGSLAGNTQQEVAHGGSGSPVEAIPDNGYHFVEWSDGNTDNPRTDQNVTEDLHVSAGFALTTYSITFNIVNVSGEPIVSAVIVLNGEEYPVGEYTFTYLEPGLYTYGVSLEGYFDKQGELHLIDENIYHTVVMLVDDTSDSFAEVNEVVVFPNPVSQMLVVESGKIMTGIRLVNLSGKIVYEAKPENKMYEMNVSDYSSGVYILQIEFDKDSRTMLIYKNSIH